MQTGVSRGRILIVDDDTTVAEILSRYLVHEGYEVESVGNGRAALERSRAERANLIVLDLMLPGMSGLDVCRRLRRFTSVPIIMLTARGEESERIFGLRLGADDYVVKPFSPREVTARIESVLRRASVPDDSAGRPTIVAGPLEIDVAARTARVDGEPAPLTAREFDLLAFLARHPGQAFTRTELLEHVWGYRFGETSTVTVHVRRLRAKVEPDPAAPTLIETVWGVGYRFRR
jgi:two-component system, OmpR family, response regulator ResD